MINKTKLARECLAKIKEYGLKVEIDGQYFKISPPSLLPIELTMDLIECPNEVMDILKSEVMT